MKLSELRKQKHITQAELANMLNVNQSAVSQWERNASQPRTSKLKMIADVLGVTIDDLFDEQETK